MTRRAGEGGKRGREVARAFGGAEGGAGAWVEGRVAEWGADVAKSRVRGCRVCVVLVLLHEEGAESRRAARVWGTDFAGGVGGGLAATEALADVSLILLLGCAGEASSYGYGAEEIVVENSWNVFFFFLVAELEKAFRVIVGIGHACSWKAC